MSKGKAEAKQGGDVARQGRRANRAPDFGERSTKKRSIQGPARGAVITQCNSLGYLTLLGSSTFSSILSPFNGFSVWRGSTPQLLARQ